VTKSFLSSTIGLAYDRGLIRDMNDLLRDDFAPVVALNGPLGVGAFDQFEVLLPFESELNSRITWDHLLRQTSDWEGTLWGKPDWVDRPPRDLEAHRTRTHYEPGTVYTYNDVRVNLLALAGLNVWRRPLPEVLRDHLMDPIGASNTWRWLGYDNSWVVMDGKLVQSVSGGAHWGGGMWINAFDLARFGLLTLHRGRWGDRQILSEEWVEMALTPTRVRTGVGYMNWFLDDDGSSFRHSGTGNTIYVYPDDDLVVVTRWTAGASRVVSAIRESIVR
jgi:CubicO group peptidase (beta-lactamase class C family)